MTLVSMIVLIGCSGGRSSCVLAVEVSCGRAEGRSVDVSLVCADGTGELGVLVAMGRRVESVKGKVFVIVGEAVARWGIGCNEEEVEGINSIQSRLLFLDLVCEGKVYGVNKVTYSPDKHKYLTGR